MFQFEENSSTQNAVQSHVYFATKVFSMTQKNSDPDTFHLLLSFKYFTVFFFAYGRESKELKLRLLVASVFSC